MGRKRAFGWRRRMAGVVVLAVLIGGGWGWWHMQHWRPDARAFPIQGVLVDASDGSADFRAFRAIGARFAYLEASDGAQARDPAFARNLAAAREAHLKVGAVHRYDPCVAADIRPPTSSPWSRATRRCCRRPSSSTRWPMPARRG